MIFKRVGVLNMRTLTYIGLSESNARVSTSEVLQHEESQSKYLVESYPKIHQIKRIVCN